VLPRALLPNLASRKSCSVRAAAGILLVLPDESRTAAEAFLQAAAAEIAALSGDALKLVWSVTENLGDWSDVRRRLTEAMDRRRGAPAAQGLEAAPADASAEDYFAKQLGMKLRDTEMVGWSPESPGRFCRPQASCSGRWRSTLPASLRLMPRRKASDAGGVAASVHCSLPAAGRIFRATPATTPPFSVSRSFIPSCFAK